MSSREDLRGIHLGLLPPGPPLRGTVTKQDSENPPTMFQETDHFLPGFLCGSAHPNAPFVHLRLTCTHLCDQPPVLRTALEMAMGAITDRAFAATRCITSCGPGDTGCTVLPPRTPRHAR